MNISWVPGDYHKFANVFSKQQAKQLPSHHSHDLAIHIENRSIPPLGPIYSLLPTELYTLWDFIHYSSYEWLVMPFWLTNAPLAFQRLINKIFAELLNICVVIYLDNILIYLDSIIEHKKHVREIFQWL